VRQALQPPALTQHTRPLVEPPSPIGPNRMLMSVQRELAV
jgi:hypothetical protein